MAPEGRTYNGSGWLYNPKFNPDWEMRKLYRLATWTNGMAFREFEFSEVGRPIIKIAEIKNGISGQTKFTEREYDRSYLIKAGDMLFCWSGQPETSIDVFWWRGVDGWLNQHIFKVEPGPDVDRVFLFYVLKYLHPYFIAIASNKQTTGLGHVTKVDLERIEVGLPPLPEQRAIAEILGALDDKIELNRRMNETLEAMARAIFKSWFVDFEPVRAKMDGRWRRGQSLPGLPANLYDLFPDSFEDSELGKIPRGWHLGTFGEIADNPRIGVSPEQIPDGAVYVGLEHIRRRSIALESWGTADGLESGKFRFSAGDVLFAKLRPYFHKVAVAPENGVCSTDILVLRPKSSEWRVFMICLAASAELVEYASALADGTRMPRTNWHDLAKYEAVLPPTAAAAVFSRHTTPLVQSIQENIRKSRTLAAIRDALLPKLISGELRVKDSGKPFTDKRLPHPI